MNEKLCDEFRRVSRYIYKWILNQPAVEETSITDWVLFSLSKNTNKITYVKFSRQVEGRKTGADWEWWFVGDGPSLSLRIQAKKLFIGEDNYHGIAYTNKHGLQIEKLREDALRKNHIPFYAFYFANQDLDNLLCGATKRKKKNHGIFLASAENIYEKFIINGRKKIEPSDVLSCSYPIHCLVCCDLFNNVYFNADNIGPARQIHNYIKKCYGEVFIEGMENTENLGLHEELPNYVLNLLNQEASQIPDGWMKDFGRDVQDINSILIFDLRGQRE